MRIMLIFVVLFSFLLSCEDEQVPESIPPTFSIVSFNSTNPFDIFIAVRITDAGSSEPVEVGVRIGTESNSATIYRSQKLYFDPVKGMYTGQIKDLAPNKYYFKPYILSKSGEFEGEEIVILTQESVKFLAFTPGFGGVGSKIMVTGLNMNSTVLKPEFYIGNIKAEIFTMHPNGIVIIVPAGITESPIKVTVKSILGEHILPGEFILRKGIWLTLPEYNGANTGFAFMLNGFGYAVNYQGDNKRVTKYNVSSSQWTFSHFFPGQMDADGGGFVIDDSPFYICSNNEVWKFTPASNSWQSLEQFPLSGSFNPVAFGFTVADEGYLAKEYNGKIGLWKRNKLDPSWIKLSDTPLTGTSFTALSFEGSAYLFGGHGGVPSSQVWKYVPDSDSWERLPDGPFPPRMNPVVFELQQKIYLGGGFGGVPYKDFYEYNPETGQWLQVSDLPTGLLYSSQHYFSIQSLNEVFVSNGLLFFKFELE